ncbi:multidrug effflux MFS transporter [Tropicibacter oceani]|uniref:Bcr/CflA family efflux transporter n=1 Tax=Tropicibacter oceani TaxID=3058420 RepID=A0ABY8QE45_9RHOB|nr:multidrug effflux MFS transporter [Tropicibacter oceani]WGW02900.1 multidrug effflux MFS transporter [Tropicibacter oceani]
MPNLPSKGEFVAIVAMLTATIAFAIDAMLPALPQLTAEFSPEDPNRVQLVVTIFVLGMGLGTLVTGPLSDAFGRKPVVLAGAGLYILSSLTAILAHSLEMLLLARFFMGLGAAGPRVVAMAIVRDLYAGRGMAQIMSFVMIIFTLVPAIAPLLGAQLIVLGGWHAVFWGFALFSILTASWFALRLPETLPRENRRPFQAAKLRAATLEVLTHPVVRLSIVAQTFCFAALFSMISNVQPIYDVFFQRADSFPLWFGGIAIASSSASFLNAALVMRVGMRRLVTGMLSAQVLFSTTMVLLIAFGLSGTALFAAFVLWQTTVFFQAGMTLGNLNALAMEPMGHIAGLAASIIGALATVGAVALAIPVSLLFDGTPLPVAIGILVQVICALIAMQWLRRAEAAQPVT